MLDFLLKGGTVVDGTGASARRADVGIRDGRIAALGRVRESASRVLDVDGLTLTPGFIDIHTHYDAQVMWDRELTPSSWHGVTTIIGGNCGFTVAPIDDRSSDYVLRMLSVVEGIPYSALETLDPSWRSFGSWLERIDNRVALNTGFFCGHSALRRIVMGDACIGEQAEASGPVPGALASDDQIRQMQRLLHESLSEGALGFSSSRSGHTDHKGMPVPSRGANADELMALCSVLREHEGTVVGFSPDELFGGDFSDGMCDLITGMALAAGRTEIINGPPEGLLKAADHAAAQGARVVGMCLPHPNPLRLNFLDGLVLDAIPGWNPVMHLPLDEKARALADPGTRAALRASTAEVPSYLSHARYGEFCIQDVQSPTLAHLVGRKVADIALERGGDAFDTLLDIALADGLETGFRTPLAPECEEGWWPRVTRRLQDPRMVLSGSDAGAHLNMVSSYDATSYLVGTATRELGLLSLEEAVRLATDVPAKVFGLRERGRVCEGYWADIAVFDAACFGPSAVDVRRDVPGGSWRLTSEAEGLHYVFVNGVSTYTDNQFSGDFPGTVLRSGRDTQRSQGVG